MRNRARCGSGLVALVLVGCQPRAGLPVAEGALQRPIVGGVVESGWRGVGALTTQVPFWGYGGSFCTASLIDPRWVLTAAHCVEDEAGELLGPSGVRFYVGADARPAADGQPPASGSLLPVDGFFRHPQWDRSSLRNDIALVHLAQAAQGVPTYAYSQQSLDANLIGRPVLYVGFGATEGLGATGGDIKRSAQVALTSIGSTVYVGTYAGAGICYGDSGGPGLLQEAGTWRIIGVNSSVASYSGDPCKGSYNHTRVDRYAAWIAGLLGQAPPSCQADPGLCVCAQACQADGSCLNQACQTRSCEQVYDCLGTCGDRLACQLDCYDAGTPEAQASLDAMLRCFEAECATASSDDAWTRCVQERCGASVEACMPPAHCDLRGGDCAAGTACGPTASGDTDCYASAGLAAGASCRLGARDPRECGDGLLCFGPPGAATGLCRHLCVATADCGVGETCDSGRVPGLTGAGVCVCADLDQDGSCVSADCDDQDARRTPGAAERCGDGIDNNCSGAIDEGCTQCVDGDHDGACVPQDCDDTRANVKPGLAETCGDGLDNNCGGGVDEGCAVCIDADRDGACTDEDCDDGRAAVRPGLVEVCGDGLDNDCSGGVDEGCPVCTDADHDGACADEDCDDASAGVLPGAPERCGDGLDNNCNGAVDEGCSTCVDEDSDGICADLDCDDASADVRPGTGERCGDGRDNDCNGLVDEDCVACTDQDQDGYCANRDCDDQDASAHQGLGEQCGDRVDNDCDGQVDEDCASCTDADGDGFCQNRDCDDGDARAHQGLAEQCGDEVDNNCDGEIDEDCVACTDVDADGFCANRDCDDGDAAVHPLQTERCGDGVDNNCDGQADEACATCTDADEDGSCAELDCDDARADVHPGAAEVCGDDLDNSCDGAIDEGCPACADLDKDGFCESLDCDDNDPARSPAATERCGDDLDDNCDGETDEGCAEPADTSRRPHVDEPEVHEPMLCAGAGLDARPGAVIGLLLVGLLRMRRRGKGR